MRSEPESDSEYLIRPYEPRRVRYLGALETGGWRVKTYAIAARERRHDAGGVGTALARARTLFPKPFAAEFGETNYGLALLIAHFDLDACRYLAAWWVDDGLLRQKLLLAPVDQPNALAEARDADHAATVFDIALLDGERRFFVEHMMSRSGADPAAYMRAFVTGEV